MGKQPPDDNQLRSLTDGAPERHDLFLGLVAPIGSSRDEVINQLRLNLTEYGYGMERVHLASLLDDLPGLSGDPLPERSDPDYYRLRMDAGDKLRKEAGDHSALAALAIVRVAEMRERRIKEAAPADTGPVAYVFDSLKHPREEQILRNVYGPGFWLVSIVQDIEERKHNLSETLASQQGRFDGQSESQLAEGLIQRDEADPDAKHGQQVRDVFAAADFFLPVRRGEDWSKHVERFLQGVFDAPFLTPTSAEDAMRHAQAASLRSAALGRQVGAVIVPVQGDPYLLGTNEVPKPGGGQFREGDSPDFRDFRTGYDPNPTYVDRMLVEVFERLASAGYFTPERNKAGGARVLAEARQTSGDRPAVLDGTRVKSLIEFTRCLHAEQAAIVSAARTGVALAGATLYTTTFPCHECTKFIVGAGIVEVQYIEPYPKSMAGELYRDLIDAVPPMSKAANNSELERIPFRPFLGFGRVATTKSSRQDGVEMGL
jgi:deoxycytidylate deaminase